MDLKLKGKTAFISGSTSGIGFATAKELAKEGVKVIINGRKKLGVEAALKRFKKEMPEASIEGIAADLSSEKELVLLKNKIPVIDILVNNVGIYTSKSFFETTDIEWQHQFEVNVMSGVRLSRYFLPKMIKSGWGRILFVSSECASLVPSDLIPYSTTKATILALSRGIAQLTKGTAVTVNAVIPGSTMTEGAESFLNKLAQKENKSKTDVAANFFKTQRTSSLLQRFATVEEIASTITYISSPLAAATNGAAIKIEGGSTGGVF
jgi:NAD(P)-dependent dehydrogenase (short-subunit alcohol dehydrogenase family)|tara:strand:+ start:1813 stop:2607 length:795 start_codon:yes stop_codon:yes gene_type:complete